MTGCRLNDEIEFLCTETYARGRKSRNDKAGFYRLADEINTKSEGQLIVFKGRQSATAIARRLFQFNFLFAATTAFINRYQLALLYIELFFFHDFPFMKTTAAECFAFVFFKRVWFFKLDYITHNVSHSLYYTYAAAAAPDAQAH